MKRPEKIMVGLSGGVDSSVAALLLLEQGHQVEGLFMKNWEEDDESGYCAAAEDLADARVVADHLGIPLRTINFSTEYWDRVFEYFLDEYRSGRTPNPDVLCNREIKFRAFLDHALELGSDVIATGHYARLGYAGDGVQLLRARDENKDQTYFLYLLDQSQLAHSRFPLGDLTKPEVRRIAEQAGFPNHKKKDSTGICFIGERKFRDFLSRYLPASPGPIVTLDGTQIGRHQGLMYYTLGQRKGLGIGGRSGASEAPWFVVHKELTANRLVVAQQHDHPLLMAHSLQAEHMHWISGSPPAMPLHCQARIRHRQPLQACAILERDPGSCEIRFEQPQRAATPGQSVVLYRSQECLGGGVIKMMENP